MKYKNLHTAYNSILLNEAEKQTSKIDSEDIVDAADSIVKDINDINQETEEVEAELDFDDIEEPLGIKDETVEQYKDTDYVVYGYKSMVLHLHLAYNTFDSKGNKKALLVFGDPGIGKSEVIRSFAQKVASYKGKKFINWDKCSKEKQEEVIASPEEYFVLVDIRAVSLDQTVDFVGIMDLKSDKKYLDTKQSRWVYFLSQKGADGILFLDEINQASKQVLSALYRVVNDYSFGGTPIARDVLIVGAGNLGAQFEDPIPQALVNRFSAGVLVANPEEWLEWAEEKNISKYIIGYVRSNPDNNFYYAPKNEDDPYPTPRQFEALSIKMRKIFKEYKNLVNMGDSSKPIGIIKIIGEAAASLCGMTWARGFMTFIKHSKSFDFEKLVKEANTLKNEKKDKLYALMIFMSNLVKKHAVAVPDEKNKQDSKNELSAEGQAVVEGIVKISNNLSIEDAVILWNQLYKDIKPEKFHYVMKFLVKGNYDVKAKEYFMKTVLQKIKGILGK